MPVASRALLILTRRIPSLYRMHARQRPVPRAREGAKPPQRWGRRRPDAWRSTARCSGTGTDGTTVPERRRLGQGERHRSRAHLGEIQGRHGGELVSHVGHDGQELVLALGWLSFAHRAPRWRTEDRGVRLGGSASCIEPRAGGWRSGGQRGAFGWLSFVHGAPRWRGHRVECSGAARLLGAGAREGGRRVAWRGLASLL
jgi:hypothetical protein